MQTVTPPIWLAGSHNCGLIGLLAGLVFLSGCHTPGNYPYPAPIPGANVFGSPAVQQPGATGAFPPAAAPVGPQSVYSGGQFAPQLVELQRRAQELDANNRQLTSQLAQIQQQSNVYRERAELLTKQLEDVNRQNSQLLATAQQYAEQARGMQASMSARGGAKLTANNSLAGPSGDLQIPGAIISQEGNLIRIRMASDQMFAPGTIQLTPIAFTMLDQFASTVKQRYPRQRLAIEAHTDMNPSAGNTLFQVANSQGQAVYEYLIQRNGLPMQQVSIIGHGPSRPIADNNTPTGRAENRRIELVIFPDTF
jgi:flagellar motor protein MotB